MSINNFPFTNLVNSPLFSFIAFIFLLLILLLIYSYLSLLNKKISKTEHKLVEEIKSSVQPKFVELSMGTENLVSLTIEIWRMEQRLNKILENLDENQKKALENSIQKIRRFLDKYDVEVRDYTGQKYNTGLTAIEVLSVEKDKKVKEDLVKETVEPAILLKGIMVKKAKVILATNH